MLNEDEVLEINQRFYKAINEQDLAFMKTLWHDKHPSICVHPGGHVVSGYDSIIQSWQDIFSSPTPLECRLADVDIVASEDLAWVTCEETIFSITMDGVKSSEVYATNLFKKFNGSWKMTLHHASNLPDQTMEEELSPG